ncbi:KpsF/GutQ family sugar-phosphate isomerase [bacterium]|nr:MAG: KpsF/GutQ family sugar-phosphate isomerase [bacterium]
MSVVETGRRVLAIEARALEKLGQSLDGAFEKAVETLYGCKGKVILTGMGKSGIICRKIAATLSSTGTPAFFLHPAEGAHGDLGVLSGGDVIVAVSNSGETAELLGLLPLIRRMGLPLISITGEMNSTLARKSDVVLFLPVKEDACPLNLAPMASTTATLALGDALSAALMEKRGVSAEDFALVHPAGSLGRRLTLTLEDLMVTGEGIPRVKKGEKMRGVIPEISGKGMGFTGVFDDAGNLLGIITDGDLRRGMEARENFLEVTAGELMHENPKSAPTTMLAADALRLMEKHSITSLFVVGEKGEVLGVTHIHHLVKAGL